MIKARLLGPCRDLYRLRTPGKVGSVRAEGGRNLRIAEDGGLQAMFCFDSSLDACAAFEAMLRQMGLEESSVAADAVRRVIELNQPAPAEVES